MKELHEKQAWLQEVITGRGNLKEKVEKAQQYYSRSIEDTIVSKRGVSAYQRVDIYAAGYVLRLVECLKNDYPYLLKFMGSSLFEVFAKAYLLTLPPNGWSLFNLGRRFPMFLLDTKPTPTAGITPNPSLDIPIEIARLERAITEGWICRGYRRPSYQ